MKTKLKKLDNAKRKLKAEFIGLDSIIDRVISDITPWYLTPELLERPQVVSIWGLTGTGKTSLIRKLLSYLEIDPKSFFLDCGEFNTSDGGDSIVKKLSEFFENEDGSSLLGVSIKDPNDPKKKSSGKDSYVFVFDEFQNARTIDESGFLVSKPGLRGIWSLMDSGILDLTDISWEVQELRGWSDELEMLKDEHSDIQLEKGGYFPKSINKVIKDFYANSLYSYNDRDGFDGDENKVKYPVLPSSKMRLLKKCLNRSASHVVGEKAIKDLSKSKTLSEFFEKLEKYLTLILRPRLLNCSKSLIFAIGNLDDAFETSGLIDPDVDADVFYELTSKVTDSDIKKSLQNLFKPEQIGRLGNNMIIYPSLTSQSFRKVIDKELDRISDKFLKATGKSIKFTEDFRKFLYSESVYPALGVRPVYTSISAILGKYLSEIYRKDVHEAVLDTETDNFNVDSIFIIINYPENKTSDRIEQPLSLGRTRNISKCKKLPLMAIHESSHAVIYSVVTGNLPETIVALASNGGGFMMEKAPDNLDIRSVTDLNNDVITGLAGYYGEREFFSPEVCSLGSSSDIRTSWVRFSDAAYSCGLFEPISVASRFMTPQGVPDGVDDKLDGDADTRTIEGKTLSEFRKLEVKTKGLVHEHRDWIKAIALELVKTRSMSKQRFSELSLQYLGKQKYNLIFTGKNDKYQIK